MDSLPRIQAETIFNPLGKTAGVVSYWVPEIRDSGLDTPEGQRTSSLWLMQGTFIPPDKRPIAAQLSDLILFDFLTANPDRLVGRQHQDVAGRRRSCTSWTTPWRSSSTPRATCATGRRCCAPSASPGTWSRALDRVTVATLERLMMSEVDGDEVLTPSEIKAVVARREVAQRHIAAVAGQFGEDEILLFP